MKIRLVQMEVHQGQLSKNFVNCMRNIIKAADEKVNLIIFPEMCLTGVMLGDLWNDFSFVKEAADYNQKLFEAAQKNKISIIWGNVFIGDKIGYSEQPTLCNAVFIAQPQHALNYRFKTNLNKYEKNYFTSNIDVRVDYPFDYVKLYTVDNSFGYYSVGLQVGEDIFPGIDDVTHELVDLTCDFQINISALPFQYIDDVEEAMKTCDSTIMFFNNCCGVQTSGKHIHAFSGESGVFSRSGDKGINKLSNFNEGIVDILYHNGIIKDNMIRITPKDDILYRKAAAIVKSYEFIDNLLEKPKYIFGLSGGLDSSVSLALAVEAIEKTRIIAMNLPTRINSNITKENAKQIAYKLGVAKYEVHQINSLNFDFTQSLSKYKPQHNISMVNEENIIARLRGNVLQSIASINGGVVVNNSNKVELALGYSTLYGDMIGAFCPLADLTKMEVSNIGNLINTHIYNGVEIVPENLLFDKDFKVKTKPSAELREKQIDPMWWGVDDEFISRIVAGISTFESILKDFIDAPLTNDFCAKYDIDLDNFTDNYDGSDLKKFVEHLEWLRNLMRRNRFKIIQCPPIVATTKSPIDILPMMKERTVYKEFDKLKKKLLNEVWIGEDGNWLNKDEKQPSIIDVT